MAMRNNKLYKLVLTALLLAVNCAATIVIQIPSPMNGYIHLGDSFVLLSGWLLGPFYGFLAGGIGSALADIMTGYAYWAVGTFIIKGLMAVIASILFNKLKNLFSKHTQVARILTGIVAELFMVIAYFGYAALILGNGLSAAMSIPGNLIQGTVGILVAVILIEVVLKLNLMKNNIK
jgi:uncharacterized membrane protein